jgi:hypothetical protein
MKDSYQPQLQPPGSNSRQQPIDHGLTESTRQARSKRRDVTATQRHLLFSVEGGLYRRQMNICDLAQSPCLTSEAHRCAAWLFWSPVFRWR